MREKPEARRRHLHIMDLCNNGEPTLGSEPSNGRGHGVEDSSAKETSTKAHHSPSPEQPKASTKRKRTHRIQKSRAAKSRAKQHSSTSPEPDPASTTPEQHHSSASDDDDDHAHPSRKRHNLVEQKYRQRLNGQFKRLLDILPTSPDDNDITNHPDAPQSFPAIMAAATSTNNLGQTGLNPGHHHHHHSRGHSGNQDVHMQQGSESEDRAAGVAASGGLGAADQRRVSKGEVLDRARRYIEALEREHRRLVAEKRELELLWEENGAGPAGAGAGGFGVRVGEGFEGV